MIYELIQRCWRSAVWFYRPAYFILANNENSDSLSPLSPVLYKPVPGSMIQSLACPIQGDQTLALSECDNGMQATTDIYDIKTCNIVSGSSKKNRLGHMNYDPAPG